MSVRRVLLSVLAGVGLLSAVFFVARVDSAWAINRQISYQGKLLDSSGAAVMDGTYQMKFRLYTTASGGTALWSASGTLALPTAIPITVQNGLFTLMLGDPSASGGWQNTLDGIDWDSDSLYLGVTIGNDSEMSPRRRLGAVPQAFNAAQLQGMYASSSASGGQTLFAFNQTENNAATSSRTTLVVRSMGTSNANDYLLRGVNDQGTNVFTVNRQGSVTSTGALTFQGSGTSTLSGSLSVAGNVSSTVLYAANATLVGLGATTLNASGLVWTNATGTNTTSTNLYATLFGFGNALGTSVTSTSLAVTGTATSTFAGSVSVAGNVSSTVLYAANATLATLSATTLSASGLVWTNATGTNTTSTNLYATLFGFGNANGTNVTTTNSYATFAQFGNALGTNVTSTSLAVTGTATSTFAGSVSVEGNVSSTRAVVDSLFTVNGVSTFDGAASFNGSVTLGDIASDTVTFNGGVVGSLLPINGGVYDLGTDILRWRGGYFVNTSSTYATSTYLYAQQATVPTLNATDITWTNAVGTNTTSTSLAVTGVATSTFTGSLSVTRNVSSTYATVDDALTVYGSGTFGDNAISDILTSIGRFRAIGGVDSNLVPYSPGYSLGNEASAWDSAYFTNTTSTSLAVIGTATSTFAGSISVAGNVSTTNLFAQRGTVQGNLFVGTSTVDVAMHSQFTMSGDDLFVGGNIGSASSVYTNGAFIVGTGSTYYGDGYVSSTNALAINSNSGIVVRGAAGVSLYSGPVSLGLNTDKDIVLHSGLGVVRGDADGAIALGTEGTRFDGYFRNATTTNAYMMTGHTQNATFDYATGTTVYATSLRALNATSTYARVEAGLYADVGSGSVFTALGSVAAGTSPRDVIADDRLIYVMNTSTMGLTFFHAASSTPPGRYASMSYSSVPTAIAVRNDTIFSVHVDGTLRTNAGASVSVGGTPTDVVAVGRYVYVTTRSPNRLVTVDASDLSNLAVVSSLSDGTALPDPTALAVNGSYAYVVNESNNNISSFSLADPTTPAAQQTIELALSVPKDIVVQGNYAYVLGSVTLRTVLISDSTNMVAADSESVSAPRSLMVSGREVFVTTASGVSIFNAADPANLAAAGSISIASANPTASAIRGRFLYVTDAEPYNLLHTYRLPGIEATGASFSSAQVGGLHVLGNGRVGQDFDVSGSLQVGNGGISTDGSFAVRATNSTSTILGNLAVGTSTMGATMHSAFSMNGDDLFVAGNIGSVSSVYTNGAFIAGTGSTYYAAGSITNTTGNFVVTSTGNFTVNTNSAITLQANNGNINLIASGAIKFNGTSVHPVADGTILGSQTLDLRFDGYFRTVTSTGRIVQALASNTSLVIRSNITSLGNNIRAVETSGDYAYVMAANKMWIYGVRDKANPVHIGNISVGSDNQDLAVYGDRVYIADYGGGTGAMYVIDVSVKTSPTLSETINTVVAPTAIEIQGRFAYVADVSLANGLVVLDLGSPTSTRVLSKTTSPTSFPVDLTIAGRYAYISQYQAGLLAYDISDPSAPSLVGNLATGAFYPGSIVTNGGYLYVANTAAAAVNVYVATTTPSLIGSFTPGGTIDTYNGLDVQGNYLYTAASGYEAMQVVDVSVPGSPTVIQSFVVDDPGDTLTSVRVSGRYAYVTKSASSNGVTIVDLGGTEVAQLRAHTGQIDELEVIGSQKIGRDLFVDGGVSVQQGILAKGPSAFTVTSTQPGAYFINRADHDTQNSSWGAYVDRLLVGSNINATGTVNYAAVFTYPEGKNGLCIMKDTKMCPDGAAITNYSLVADVKMRAAAFEVAGFDLAERYPFTGAVTSSDVLVIEGASPIHVKASGGVAYDPRIIGVASTQPGLSLGYADMPGVPVALTGRVPTKVSAVNGPIAIGDALTTSEYPGVAMKATKPGMIVGYALEVATATSTIEVFVKPGYSAGSILGTDGRVARLTDDLEVAPRAAATASVPTQNSWGLTFRGSAWDGTSVTQPSFGLLTQVTTATSSAFVIRNASSSNVFAIDQLGTATIAGDVVIGGRLYPSGRGSAQQSKYIFLDDTSTSTQYMATNADGWQANDAYDFAERYYSPDKLEMGDLVIASDRGQFHVQRSLNEGTMLMGIVSTRPAFVAGKPGPDTYPIALAGRVPTKVSTMNGVINVGDPLGPSSIPGTAVKATKAGPIVGLALEKYDMATVGKIEVFVNPGWWGGEEEDHATRNTQHATTETSSATEQVADSVSVSGDGTMSYRGFAVIAAGSKRVHVAYDSVLSYPNVQATPRGQVRGGWWTDNYTDIGFDILLNDEQTRDITFTWSVQGTPTGARVYRSDGTYGLVNPTTGEALMQTLATSTEPVAEPVSPPATTRSTPPVPTTTSSSTAATEPAPSSSATEPVTESASTPLPADVPVAPVITTPSVTEPPSSSEPTVSDSSTGSVATTPASVTDVSASDSSGSTSMSTSAEGT